MVPSRNNFDAIKMQMNIFALPDQTGISSRKTVSKLLHTLWFNFLILWFNFFFTSKYNNLKQREIKIKSVQKKFKPQHNIM